MATITHTRGDTLPLTLALPDDASAATLQVHTLTGCVEITGSLSGGSASFAPAALDTLTPGRVYRTTARLTREGTTQTIDSFALLILEGCGNASPAPSGIILSGALVEAGADVASGAASVALVASGALAEVGADTATGTVTVTTSALPGITLTGALVETGADTAAGSGAARISGSAALVEAGADTAAGAGVVASETVDWFATDGSTFPWYTATRDTGVYDEVSDKTFLTWERWTGTQRVCQVDCYDHTAGEWLPSAQAGTSVLYNDDHGVPAIAISPTGYLWTFFGPHSNNMRIRASANPRDHTSWVALPDIASQALTYPHPVFVGSTLHLFARKEGNPAFPGTNRMPLVLFTAPNVTGNAATFGSVQILSDFGGDSRNYLGTVQTGPDGYIWIANTRANFGDNYRRDVFIFRFNPANGDIANIDGSVVVPAASRPIDRASAEASFRVVTTNPTGTGVIPHFCWDTAGRLHLVYGDGPSGTEVRNYHMMWNGSVWTAPVEVMNQKNRYATVSPAPLGDGIEIIGSVSLDGTGRGVDIYRNTRSASGVFSGPELIAAGGTYGLDVPNPIHKAKPELRWMWAEVSGGGSGSNTSVSNDEYAGYQRVFAWGDGYRKRKFEPQLALSRTTINAGLGVGDMVGLVTSRQPRETLTITDPSGSFALDGRKVVAAKALSVGAYPITITSDFRGLTAAISPTITVAAAENVTDKALLRLDFDEAGGQQIVDKTGNGLDGYLGSSPDNADRDLVRTSVGVENGYGGNTITLPFKPILNAPANIHVFAPIQLIVNNAGGAIVARRHGFKNENAYVFDVTNGRLRWTHYNIYKSVLSALNPTATLAVDQWALVEAQVNGRVVTLRQDGAVVYEATLSSEMILNNEADFHVGGYISAGGTFGSGLRGRTGCVHVYPRVLSASEAQEARTLIRGLMAGRGVTLP